MRIYFILIIILLFIGCTKTDLINNQTLTGSSLKINNIVDQNTGNNKNDLAPNFNVITINSENFDLFSYIGNKAVVIYFWDSYCSLCRKDFSIIKYIYPNYKEDIIFISINTNSLDSKEIINNYINEMDIQDIKFATATNTIIEDYDAKISVKYGIGRDGIILWKKTHTLSERDWDILFKDLQSS